MQKLIFVLLAFLALFTIISAFADTLGAEKTGVFTEKTAEPVEIVL